MGERSCRCSPNQLLLPLLCKALETKSAEPLLPWHMPEGSETRDYGRQVVGWEQIQAIEGSGLQGLAK